MPFPVTKRIIYKKNPLIEVICQFRFPAILSIDTEVPAKFQDAIRKKFPFFKENAEILLNFPDNPNEATQPLPEKIQLPPTAMNRKNYEFLSADNRWKINLTRDFMALSTLNYHRWEEFKVQLEEVFKPFLDIYSPIHFSRIGLRYKDIINLSQLGLENTNWSELLTPQILGVLNDSTVAPNVSAMTTITEIRLNQDKNKVRITSGLVENTETKEQGFLIDCDFFTEQNTSVENSLPQLDYFNQRGSRLIQWVITEKLHNAMEPENI